MREETVLANGSCCCGSGTIGTTGACWCRGAASPVAVLPACVSLSFSDPLVVDSGNITSLTYSTVATYFPAGGGGIPPAGYVINDTFVFIHLGETWNLQVTAEFYCVEGGTVVYSSGGLNVTYTGATDPNCDEHGHGANYDSFLYDCNPPCFTAVYNNVPDNSICANGTMNAEIRFGDCAEDCEPITGTTGS